MAERTGETKAPVPGERQAELIMNRLQDFLSIRFDHASRINTKLKIIKQDLLYHEMASVRACLLGDKIYGPSRRKVADVFLGDEEKPRRNLMSPAARSASTTSKASTPRSIPPSPTTSISSKRGSGGTSTMRPNWSVLSRSWAWCPTSARVSSPLKCANDTPP